MKLTPDQARAVIQLENVAPEAFQLFVAALRGNRDELNNRLLRDLNVNAEYWRGATRAADDIHTAIVEARSSLPKNRP